MTHFLLRATYGTDNTLTFQKLACYVCDSHVHILQMRHCNPRRGYILQQDKGWLRTEYSKRLKSQPEKDSGNRERHAVLLFPQLRQSGAQTGDVDTKEHVGDRSGRGGE